jgi:5'-nucleotidase
VTRHLLLTNDDGFQAHGLRVLREALVALGERVTTIAPAANRSGVGRGVTIHREVVLRLEAEGPNPVYSCTGLPVDCVRIGLLSDAVGAVDAVVSGINHGLNLGDDLTYSGTVAAALEGALLGYPAVAFSQEPLDHDLTIDAVDHPLRFPLVAAAAAVALAIVGSPPAGRVAVNVNLPIVPDRRSIALTRPSAQRFPPGFLRPTGRDGRDSLYVPYATPDGPVPEFEGGAGTDVAAIRSGTISLGVVSAEWGGGAVSGRRRWFDAVVPASLARLG